MKQPGKNCSFVIPKDFLDQQLSLLGTAEQLLNDHFGTKLDPAYAQDAKKMIKSLRGKTLKIVLDPPSKRRATKVKCSNGKSKRKKKSSGKRSA